MNVRHQVQYYIEPCSATRKYVREWSDNMRGNLHKKPKMKEGCPQSKFIFKILKVKTILTEFQLQLQPSLFHPYTTNHTAF